MTYTYYVQSLNKRFVATRRQYHRNLFQQPTQLSRLRAKQNLMPSLVPNTTPKSSPGTDKPPDTKNSAKCTIPQAFLAFKDGWTEKEFNNEPIELFMEKDYLNDHNVAPFIETFTHMVSSMASALKSRGQEHNCVNAFKYLLPEHIVSKLLDATTQHLVNTDNDPIEDTAEYYEFIATKMLRSRFKMSDSRAFRVMEGESKTHKFVLMDQSRYNAIVHCTGYPTTADELDTSLNTADTWGQEKRKFRSFADFEKIFFERSIAIFLNKKNGKLVVDDELISSKSVDVELKCVSQRKQGKEGPVADCISCSLTSAVYGMRLRLRGDKQESNVLALIDHLPRLTNPSHSITICFDRGYGKLNFVSQIAQLKFNVLTIAPQSGSRHPFILQEEVDKYLKIWRESGLSEAAIKAKIDVFRAWIYHHQPYIGSDSRVACKQLVNNPVYATVLRDVFDRKADCKELRMFSVGNQFTNSHNKWIAYKSKNSRPESLLFSKKDEDGKWSSVEQFLKKNCYPLTTVQRTADWFLMKSFRITGTMASVISHNKLPVSAAYLSATLDSCINSWFGRHRSNENMQIGTDNEDITAKRFQTKPYVVSFHNCGLLCWKKRGYFGVSPDGVAQIMLPSSDTVICSVEIKTRVAEKTISKALKAYDSFGGDVFCCYGDDVFSQCVPSENHVQLLHQSVVLGTTHGVFITSKVESAEGCIIQAVIFSINDGDKNNHISTLQKVCDPMLGWMWDVDSFKKGYFNDSNFPLWVKESQRNVIKSRVRLWLAHSRYVDENNNGFCLPPVRMYKHSSQFIYNKGKGGLDQSSECEQKVKSNDKLCFKRKYVFRMMDAVITNGWRIEQGRTILIPYLKKQNVKNEEITVSNLRRQLYTSTLENYIYDTSIEMLQALKGVPKRKILMSNTENEGKQPMELMMNSVISEFRKNHTWPIIRDRLKHFSDKATGLPDLRLLSSDLVNHAPIPITGDTNKDRRRICPLCVSTKGKYQGKTSFQCCICKVPLCTRIRLNEKYNTNDPRHGKTHFEVWHSVNNLSILNNCGSNKLVSPNKRKRAGPTKKKFCASTDKIVEPMKGTNLFFSPESKKFFTSKVVTPAVVKQLAIWKPNRDNVVDLCDPSSNNGIELNKMVHPLPLKLSYFDANLKLSFVCYNKDCSFKDDVLRYDRESQSFIIVNRQILINTRFKKIKASHIERIHYYIGNDIDVIEIGDKTDSTSNVSYVSNTCYLRFMRRAVFCVTENDWYDVVFRPRCNDDLNVFIVYLKELVHPSVAITHVKSIDISKQIVNHLQQNCITHKVDNDKLRKREDKVLFMYPMDEPDNINRISISSLDFKTLNPKTWLNDKIIKLYLTMLEHQYKNEDIQIMDSYFYTTLVNNGCKALSSWFRIPALLRKKVIIIPINQFQYHWSLMLVVRPDMLQNVSVSNEMLPCNAQRTVLVGLDSASTGISLTASKDIHLWLNFITKRSKNT